MRVSPSRAAGACTSSPIIDPAVYSVHKCKCPPKNIRQQDETPIGSDIRNQVHLDIFSVSDQRKKDDKPHHCSHVVLGKVWIQDNSVSLAR